MRGELIACVMMTAKLEGEDCHGNRDMVHKGCLEDGDRDEYCDPCFVLNTHNSQVINSKALQSEILSRDAILETMKEKCLASRLEIH